MIKPQTYNDIIKRYVDEQLELGTATAITATTTVLGIVDTPVMADAAL
jgi:hypothetical protein